MFSLVNGLLFRPLYAGADEVVEVDSDSSRPLEKRETSPTRTIATSRQARPASLRTWRLTQWRSPVWMPARGAAGVCRRGDRRLLPRLWHACGPRTYLHDGRGTPGAGIGVAIISHSLWEQLGATPETLGRVVRINGEQFTVVGVAPEGFTGASIPGPEVFLPLGAYKTFKGGTTPSLDSREAHELNLIGRLKPGMLTKQPRRRLPQLAGNSSRRLSVNAGYSLDMSRPSSRLHVHAGVGNAEFAAWRCC